MARNKKRGGQNTSLMSPFSFLWRPGSSAECDWGWLQGHNGHSHSSSFGHDLHPAPCSAERKSTITAVSWSTLLHVHLPLEKGKTHTKYHWMLLRKGCAAILRDVAPERRHCSLYLYPKHIPAYIWEGKDATGEDFFFLWFLWFKQCHSWRRAKQLIPLGAAIMHGCISCAGSPSHSHCAQSFGALFPYSRLLAEMQTARFPRSHSLPSNLKSNCFLLAFLVSIFLSIFHLILIWIIFSQGSWIRSNGPWILVWSWWVHCYPEAFPGLLNLAYVQKNFLLHIPCSFIMSLALVASLSVTEPLKAACGGAVGEAVEMGIW